MTDIYSFILNCKIVLLNFKFAMVAFMLFSDTEVTELPLLLSAPRFETYLIATNGKRSNALELYEWNLKISSAFLIPLHLCEIVIRNAVSESIAGIYGENWHINNAFLRSLPDPKKHYNAKRDLQGNQRLPSVGKVIAELKPIFWQQMFTSRHDPVIWNSCLRTAFPNLDENISVQLHRSRIYEDLGIIRNLRNRIAHHEPIFSRDLQNDLGKIAGLVHLRNINATVWLNRLENITNLTSIKPM